jgi:hypothetical protein
MLRKKGGGFVAARHCEFRFDLASAIVPLEIGLRGAWLGPTRRATGKQQPERGDERSTCDVCQRGGQRRVVSRQTETLPDCWLAGFAPTSVLWSARRKSNDANSATAPDRAGASQRQAAAVVLATPIPKRERYGIAG